MKSTPDKLRSLSLRRFKRFELISVIILTIIIGLLSILVFESTKPGAENEAVFNATLLVWGAMALHSAIVIRASFMRMSADYMISRDKTDYPLRGWRFTLFTPLIATVILLPAIFTGTYNPDDTNTFVGLLMVLMMSFGALLMGALVAAFVIAPIEALIRGLFALATGNKANARYIYFGLFGLFILSIIILGTMAIDPNASYPSGSVQIVLAVLGIPGIYSIQSEVLLWTLRATIVVLILLCVGVSGARRKNPATQP